MTNVIQEIEDAIGIHNASGGDDSRVQSNARKWLSFLLVERAQLLGRIKHLEKTQEESR